MRRRDLIVFFAGATLFAMPRVAKAQQAGGSHRIGILAQDLQPGLLDNFRAGMRDFGYVEEKNIRIESATQRAETSGCLAWRVTCCGSRSR